MKILILPKNLGLAGFVAGARPCGLEWDGKDAESLGDHLFRTLVDVIGVALVVAKEEGGDVLITVETGRVGPKGGGS